MTRIAVVGAAGFIGNRAVEILHLAGRHAVVPIVRRASALALIKRFDLEPLIADAWDAAALEKAFANCDAVVSAIAGDPATLIGTVDPIYRAADRAGVRRLVYLSSASVHGQAPAPGTDERSRPSTRQPFPYNRAKAVAERRLLALRRGGRTELVILRPSIVYGPRSQWTGGLADQILSGEAFLADAGNGICNAIYVDNLVHAILLAIEAAGVDREIFLLGDAETVTWRALVSPIAAALGADVDAMPQPSSAEILDEKASALRGLIFSSARYMFRKLPRRTAHALRAARRAAREHRQAAAPPSGTEPPHFSRELALLHSCSVRLPSAKAERMLGYRPPISFDEGCRRSVAWLEFAGYPTRSGTTR